MNPVSTATPIIVQSFQASGKFKSEEKIKIMLKRIWRFSIS
jgi:hypothetical protein